LKNADRTGIPPPYFRDRNELYAFHLGMSQTESDNTMRVSEKAYLTVYPRVIGEI